MRTRAATRSLFVPIGVALILALGMLPARADVTFNPPSGTWNGKIIYLSRSCHDGNDGVPGGPCIENTGCKSMKENQQSEVIAARATYNTSYTDLLDRGFRVIIGNGTAGQNIQRSNTANSHLHVPLHTNARTDKACSNTTKSNFGTWGMYVSTNGKNCSQKFVTRVGALSPGTNDVTVYRTNLGELNQTNAVSCYLESEFHSWNQGVDWILDSRTWSARIGWAVDEYLGYP